MTRPNILLITTDQQRADHLGIKGFDAVRTPNLDRLGREGVHFDRAYCPSPICTPSRVSMLTGQYPSRHGAWSIGVSADPFPQPTVPGLLSAAGYRTALFGKSHFVRRADEARHIAGRADPAPEDFRTYRGPYVGFEQVQLATGHTINTCPDMHYRVFLEDAGVDYKPWFPQLGPHYDHNTAGAWNIPARYHDTQWVANLTEQFIRECDRDQPWFCWASFQDPHEPFVCPEPWFSSVDVARLAPYAPHRPGEFDDKPAFYQQMYDNHFEALSDDHLVPCVFPDARRDELAMTCLQATAGMIAFIDHALGQILGALKQTGQAEHTLVVFTSDHGEMHGHHGFWGKGLTAYEDCQRVPLLAWSPGLVQPKGTTSALANLVDLPRTFLALAEVPIPQGMQGVSLLPLLRGQTDEVQDATLVECQATQRIFQATLITDRYKLVIYRDSPDGELYDLNADPDQYVNLWSRPDHDAHKARLLHRLVQLQIQQSGEKHARQSFA